MAKEFSILFVTPEVFPYSNETTVADVSYSLTLALKEEGHDVRIMMPKFGNVSERKNRIHEINRLKDLTMKMGDKELITSIKSSSNTNNRNKVQTYITTNDDYFNDFKGAYHDQKTWEEHPEQVERFIFFSKTVIETCVLLNWFPQVIHCNNWESALIPAYARKLYPKEFEKTKFVLTVHNFYEHGADNISKFKITDLPDDIKDDFTHDKKLNLLKGGLIHADYITTVSKSYANDVLKDEKLSNGLNSILKSRKKNFKGIDNRVDMWTWNPEKDELLTANYEEDFEEFKYHNKVELINRFGLEYDPKKPLIALNVKIDNKDELKLFIDSADKVFAEELQVILIGPGDKELDKKLSKIREKYEDKFAYKLGFSEELASEIEAGSDMYFILPEYATAGVKFMQACLYGSIPIIRVTGALEELAEDFDPETEEGNAITFKEYSEKEFIKALKRALGIYRDKDTRITLARNGMLEEFNWDENIKEYELIYRNLLK